MENFGLLLSPIRRKSMVFLQWHPSSGLYDKIDGIVGTHWKRSL